MPKLFLLKLSRNTNLWRKGQKVWSIFPTGSCAHYVIGKYKGKGRWIKGWVHFQCEAYPFDSKSIGFVEVKENFKQMLLLKWGKKNSHCASILESLSG